MAVNVFLFISLILFVVFTFGFLVILNGSYLNLDLSNHETAIAGTIIHGFEWLFYRLALGILIIGIVGAIYTGKKD